MKSKWETSATFSKGKNMVEDSIMHPVTRRRFVAITSLALALLLCSAILAEPVGVEQAEKATDTFLRLKDIRQQKEQKLLSARGPLREAVGKLIAAGTTEIRGDDGTVLAYVTELQPQGFIATSTDTDITPIIAYSTKSNFPMDDENNPLFHMLKKDMELRLRAVSEYSESKKIQNNNLWHRYTTENLQNFSDKPFQQWPEEGTTSTGGWVETAWHQVEPYNKFCPIDPQTGERCKTGCVATAAAQIVNYHKYVDNPIFDSSDSYTSNSIQIDADSAIYDFPSFDRLNQLLSNVQYKYDNNIPLEDDDFAAINFACGIALGASYSSSSTSASGLSTNSFVKLSYYSVDAGNVYADFYNILRRNMMNGLPAILDIRIRDACGGHIIVVDGYNADGFYHVNFGWTSELLAWMRVPEDFPAPYDYINGAVFDIVPKVESYVNLISSDVTEINLGGSYVANNNRIKNFTLSNINSTSVVIQTLCHSDHFKIGRTDDMFFNELPDFEINAGETEIIYVQFQPDSVGCFNAELIFKASSQDKTQFLPIDLKAYGIPEGATIVNEEDWIYGVWQKEESPYYICDDIDVGWSPQGLTIEPGTVIKVFEGRIDVDYKFKAMGTRTERITFTAADVTLGWQGMRFWYNQSPDNELTFCTVSHVTRAPTFTGLAYAVEIHDSSLKMTNNIIAESIEGIYITGNSSPALSNNTICNNREYGIKCSQVLSEDCKIFNNIICNNDRGGITCRLSSPQIVNNTIVNNGADSNSDTAGIYCRQSSSPLTKNNIIWGNAEDSSQQIVVRDSTNNPRIEYNNIQRGIEGVSTPQGFSLDFGQGNINRDPCFVNPTSDVGKEYDALSADWHLLAGSPCIDAGNPTDSVGYERFPHGFRVNLAAYGGTHEAQITTGPSLATAPNPVDFGGVPAHCESQTTFYLKNGGDRDIEVTSVYLLEGTHFNLTDSNGAPEYHGTLTPGTIHILKLTLTPTPYASWAYDDTIMVVTDKLGPIQVAVSAQAYPGTLIADEYVSGTWTFNDSPFYVLGDISVAKGESLVIEPGISVLFAGQFKLTVGENATLSAKGNKEKRISLLPTDIQNTWEGISFINSGSDDILDYCTIKFCKYTSGESEAGAIYCNNSSPTISNCIIRENVGRHGGAISCKNNSSPIVINNFIANNRVQPIHNSSGGGIYCLSSSPLIQDNIIVNNTSETNGGGMMVDGGLSIPVITNNVICNNYAYYDGGGVEFWYGIPCMKNTIVWGNTAGARGHQILIGHVNDSEITFSDIQGGLDSIEVVPYGSALPGEYSNNLNTNPRFVSPSAGAGADYNGLGADWHLQPNSPCINAGDPNYITGAFEVDIDGNPRILGGRIDVGADEFNYAELSDLNNDGAVNFKDFDLFAHYWVDYICSEPDWCQRSDLNRTSRVDSMDLLIFTECWLERVHP